MTVSILVAMDERRGIGIQNRLPWRLPADLAYVKRTTMGKALLMGRKTFDSIGKPLPGRHNIVLTRDPAFQVDGVTVVHSVAEALERFAHEELIIFGGSEIYKLFLPYVDRMYITYLQHTFETDATFPDVDMSEWVLVSNEQGVTDEKNPYTYFFRIYDRKR
jgi:dihydrofolate reductase